MKAALNYGLNFIKHVDCGREVSKEKKIIIIINIYIAQIPCEYVQMRVTNKYERAN